MESILWSNIDNLVVKYRCLIISEISGSFVEDFGVFGVYKRSIGLLSLEWTNRIIIDRFIIEVVVTNWSFLERECWIFNYFWNSPVALWSQGFIFNFLRWQSNHWFSDGSNIGLYFLISCILGLIENNHWFNWGLIILSIIFLSPGTLRRIILWFLLIFEVLLLKVNFCLKLLILLISICLHFWDNFLMFNFLMAEFLYFFLG